MQYILIKVVLYHQNPHRDRLFLLLGLSSHTIYCYDRDNLFLCGVSSSSLLEISILLAAGATHIFMFHHHLRSCHSCCSCLICRGFLAGLELTRRGFRVSLMLFPCMYLQRTTLHYHW
jgi:hypothetical protein